MFHHLYFNQTFFLFPSVFGDVGSLWMMCLQREFQIFVFRMASSWQRVWWCPGGKKHNFLYSNPEQAGAWKIKAHLLPRQLQSTHKPDLEGSTCPVCSPPVFPFILIDERGKGFCSWMDTFRNAHVPEWTRLMDSLPFFLLLWTT